MAYTIAVNHPHFPEGMIFNVGGLDRVPNGGTLEVDEESERLFMLQMGRGLEDAFANDIMVKVTGTSELDESERKSIIEAFAPPEEELLAESEPEDTTPTWLQHNEGGEE